MLQTLASMIAAAQFQVAPDNESVKSFRIERTDAAPVIDGRLDEPLWSRAAVVNDLYQLEPVEFGEPSELTDVYVLYDDEALYVGARMWHESPEPMRANFLRQGDTYWGDEIFAVIIDPFHDRRNGYRFQINLNSVRMEAVYRNTSEHVWDWQGIWYAEATQDDRGWIAEMAIPFKTLSFDPNNDQWGINFRRHIGYNDQKTVWESRNQETNPATAGTMIGIAGLELGRGLDIVSSVSLRESRVFADSRSDFDTEPSLDIFYKLTPTLNASLTLNTDFSAAEVDDRQVNLTRFGLFFPEKRGFFLKDTDIFEYGRLGRVSENEFSRPTLENGRPFFSRRIGLSGTGQPVDLTYGGKLSGRVGRWNVGGLIINQDEFGDVDSGDIFVGRVAANVLEESTIGMIMTAGDPRSNLDNTLIGFDFLYQNTRFAGRHLVEAEAWYQQSDTEGVDGEDSAYGLRFRMPNNRGLRAGIGAKALEENFYPALGFVNRTGIIDYTFELGYTQQFERDYVREIFGGIDMQRIEGIDGGLQTEVIKLRALEIDTTQQDKFLVSHTRNKEVLLEPFEISDGVFIAPGTYSFNESGFDLEFGSHRRFFGTAGYADGDFYDGERLVLKGDVSYRPSPRLRAAVGYEYNDITLPAGEFVVRLVTFQTDLIFSSKLSWVNLVQYDNVTETIGINSRLHWVPEAGREGFIVLNHNLQDFDRDNNFDSSRSDLTLKFNYTFRF